jgi:hypothetical protein
MRLPLDFVKDHFGGEIEKATEFLKSVQQIGSLDEMFAALRAYQVCQFSERRAAGHERKRNKGPRRR